MKKTISIISIAILLSTIVAPILANADSTPAFNYFWNDLKTLNVANQTASTGWQDISVSANANDSVAFQVYYHNGVAGSIANNTRVRLNFPTLAQNTINVGASLSADNASLVTDSVTINNSSAQKLSFDTTSIKWYANRSATPTIVPATLVGSGFIELNIGDIQGGWEYQGYVTFTANLVNETVNATPQFNYMTADLKTLNVANRTANTGWQDNSVSAATNDSVAFQVYYHNGVINTVAHNTRVRLNFPINAQNTININVSLGADNASAVTDNVTINNSTAQKLVIDNNSIKWYPNRSQTPTTVTATASGAGYTELNIGDINGCWEYQGYVTFTASLVNDTTPGLAPQFNIFTPYTHTQTYNRDYYLLDVKNDTKGTAWGFPATADAGDTLTFYAYYHNGIVGSTANNTMLKVALPSTHATNQNVSASLWSDNSTNATAANPMTQSVPITLSSPQKFDYIAGSAKWYPNQTNWATATPTVFPGGQSGDQLFTSGINIGAINGCWEFSGAIVFQVKVSNLQHITTLTIDKKIKNITNNDMVFADSANAEPRQRIGVQLIVTNSGTGMLSAANVTVKDQLPSRLLYLPSTTTINNVATADGIASAAGLNLGNLSPGQSKTIYFETEVAIESQFVRGVTNLTNTASAYADSINAVQDSALLVVTYTGCSPQQNMPGTR